VAAWIELQTQTHSAPAVKQRLAAIRHLSDWLLTSQIVPHNPAASVRGPVIPLKRGKRSVLDATEARQLLNSIDVSEPSGLRDRANRIIGVSFARIGAALATGSRTSTSRTAGCKYGCAKKAASATRCPAITRLETHLHACLDGPGIADDPKGPLMVRPGRSRPGSARRSAATRSARRHHRVPEEWRDA
jgi:hypothetical protein